MKGEYVETKNTNSPNMFSKLQQLHHQHQHQHHHHHHQQQQQQQHHHPFSHHFQLSRDSQTSEEETNSVATNAAAAAAAAAKSSHVQEPNSSAGGGDGATIEVVRRPRGRPPGSKNKPKPPVFITREPEPSMSTCILEVPGGKDVIETILNFCRRKSIGVSVLTASGTVANVTLRQPSATPGSTITFHGRFDILSISATFLTQQNAACPHVPNVFAISLAGPQGQVVGGSVAGPLLAAGTVFIVASMFSNPSYHLLPDQEEQSTSVSAGGVAQSPVGSSGGGNESGHVAGGESCGMSMYGCHLSSAAGVGGDVIWAQTARPPPPY